MSHLYSTLYRVDHDHADRDPDNMHFTGSFDQEAKVIMKDLQCAGLDMNLNHLWTMLLKGMNTCSDEAGNLCAFLPESTSPNVMLRGSTMPVNRYEQIGYDLWGVNDAKVRHFLSLHHNQNLASTMIEFNN